MERLISIDQKIIQKGKPDQNTLPKILKATNASREYCVNGVWSNEKPAAKPEGNRVVFSSIDQFRTAKDVYFAWKDLVSQQVAPFEQQDVILERLLQSRNKTKPLVLFVPWGVRPIGAFGESEREAMSILGQVSQSLQKRNCDNTVLLMPADVYATEINQQVNHSYADSYFQTVRNEASLKGFMVKPWSEIRNDNEEKYNRLFSSLDPQTILPTGTLERALKAASRRSGYEEEMGIASAANAYLRERLCEADIIENVYQPIKVSMVAKGKDAYVDRNLPRIYILPEGLQFPWLQ